MNIFRAISNFFARLIKGFNGQRTAQVLDSIEDLVRLALPVVEAIARATPTRADDEILSVVNSVGLPLSGLASDWLRNDQLVKDALRATAVETLRKQGVAESDSVVNAAVELAYSIFKAKK